MKEMSKIEQKFSKKKKVISFEVFPLKKLEQMDTLYATIDRLRLLLPDFISVTYGAGGVGAANTITADICAKIQNEYKTDSIAHLTCLHNSKADIDRLLEKLSSDNVKNILALRGDRNPDIPEKNDFKYASDLVSYIMDKNMGFELSGACYPEVHPEAKNMAEDILNLKHKVDAGVGHLITQLFFDNDTFYDFLEKVRAVGINVPVEAGIMPVTDKKQIEKMVAKCGASIPVKLAKVLQRFGDNSESMQKAGIEYAAKQICGLMENGVDGVHIYTMNKPEIAEEILRAIR